MKRSYQAMILGTGTVLAATVITVPVFAQSGMNGRGRGMMSGNTSAQSIKSETGAATGTVVNGSLNASETATLQYMLEEEKLAHDIYTKMYEKWGVNIFSNISRSETMHQTMLQKAANSYGISDTRSSQVGVFTNPDLQKLYDSLLAKGLGSQTAAYEVGRAIEEVDIADLDTAISESNSAYLDNVYTRLKNGSQNHLKAFTSRLNS